LGCFQSLKLIRGLDALSASLKQKWGERGCNKMPSRITYVTTLDLNGLPTEPPEARKVFKYACGF
jgi:hypothetical protein